ncbi:TetR family transcriptional regulator [Petropleomorpha daqingensis]|uniref:AcrR family transcriptional regulator n=1 Tax=Petropleomorpha daqingensis TaxID=2026353 RepID=A0A853CM90_9ACTN|nr:AcrR family transcriptional regulator [Petropleomorpha daqingensis]
MSTFSAEPTSREERRRRTEACILHIARRLFAEEGFDRATIRAVAQRAGVDPALVMQYFGSKEGLFAAAMKGAHGGGQLREAERADIPAAALHDLFAKFEETTDREAAAALARNFLTHPEAHRIMRDEVMCSLVQGLAGKIGGKDAELKAALVMACTFGLGLARYLLQIPGLAQAQRADIERLLEPALRAVLDAGD